MTTSNNTQHAKQLIYETLKNSADLNTAMGVPSGTGVKEGTPTNLSEYPCVTYNFAGGLDEPYNPDQATGIEDDIVRVEMFSKTVDSTQVDNMSDAVKEALHGKNLYDASLGVRVFSCYRESWGCLPEGDIGVWHAWHKYRLVHKS